ncbi:ADP-ribose pyrophosphatase [Clostridium tetanomorphum]|uniref:NUDIX hydrolase n=1 Tax=Clostridium tetanomorphum TaxID=1553 RepID=UPI00044874E0|nr:NUDIX hydrolase [Clostridium tetanomorphum]KAJ52790.1 phosphohydrolase (mutT family protein) [Clostridium tetanomorphum DSM 665]MBP1865373.1 ADP-ribose pyrophosphatase [Clostridium tetanomorphum]NRS84860.1 ADP-ribose pyrophosphatase [Clostridium tetanomorphum]SQB91625.1 phosphohydrolase (mutT family protein) [Clostridium tetanomorphum]
MKESMVYSGWLKLYKRELNGRSYEIVKNHSAVSAIVINEFDEILLVKQFRPSIMKETLEIPAGLLDIEGEEIEECLIREIKEETALDIKKEELRKVISYKPILGFSSSSMHLFEVRISKDSFDSEKIKDVDVTEGVWIPFKEFEGMVLEEKIEDDKTIMAYFYLKNKIATH